MNRHAIIIPCRCMSPERIIARWDGFDATAPLKTAWLFGCQVTNCSRARRSMPCKSPSCCGSNKDREQKKTAPGNPGADLNLVLVIIAELELGSQLSSLCLCPARLVVQL